MSLGETSDTYTSYEASKHQQSSKGTFDLGIRIRIPRDAPIV